MCSSIGIVSLVEVDRINRLNNLGKTLEEHDISLVRATVANAYEIDVFILFGPTDIFKTLSNKVVILEAENQEILNSVAGSKGLCVITCGLGYKSTVTASSVAEGECAFCLQRNIFALRDKKPISSQEFVVKTYSDTYYTLALSTALLLCGLKSEQIASLTF